MCMYVYTGSNPARGSSFFMEKIAVLGCTAVALHCLVSRTHVQYMMQMFPS